VAGFHEAFKTLPAILTAGWTRGWTMVGSGLQADLDKQLRRAIDQLGRPDEARHDGIHQARKALRRSRAVLALAAPAWAAEEPAAQRATALLRRADAELRRICRGLSSLRDADALQDALLHLARDAVIGPLEAERLGEPVLALRQRRLDAALRRDPDFARRRARIARLAAALHALPWPAVAAEHAAAAHATARGRLEKARRRARRSTDPEVWHRLRRRLRRLRQQEQVLARAAPELGLRTEGLEVLATRMGLAQDHALLLAHCRRSGVFAAADRALLRRLVEPLYAEALEATAAALAASGGRRR